MNIYLIYILNIDKNFLKVSGQEAKGKAKGKGKANWAWCLEMSAEVQVEPTKPEVKPSQDNLLKLNL